MDYALIKLIKKMFFPKSCLKKGCDDPSEESQMPPSEKKVRFDKIRVRSYPIVIGDNPSVVSMETGALKSCFMAL